MYRIAAVGDFEDTAYFGAIGAKAFFPKSQKEAARLMKGLMQEEYAIIFVSDKYFAAAPRNDKAILPAIVPIPDKSGESTGDKQMSEYIKRAVGSDIDFDK